MTNFYKAKVTYDFDDKEVTAFIVVPAENYTGAMEVIDKRFESLIRVEIEEMLGEFDFLEVNEAIFNQLPLDPDDEPIFS